MVSWKSACVLTNPFVKRGLNRAYIIFERNSDKLSSVNAYDFDTAWLFLHIIFLAKYVSFWQFAHHNCLLPYTTTVL